ncbi:MAG TPA: hypothetical protein VE309_01475 [Caulobacteraceae bacterium]|nr:hypothetical protein [Caulobacteraceae bacterium]
MATTPTLPQRLLDAAKDFDARTAPWPIWKRLLVFVPILIVLSAVLVLILCLIVFGVTSIRL